MSNESKEIFLSNFSQNNKNTHVGFCVLGGRFSEGVDLTNDKLLGVIVIGGGMPQIGVDRDIIKKHFDSKSHNGFDYAYTYPGIIKVLQAVLRCIRTNKDKGIIMLIFIDTLIAHVKSYLQVNGTQIKLLEKVKI